MARPTPRFKPRFKQSAAANLSQFAQRSHHVARQGVVRRVRRGPSGCRLCPTATAGRKRSHPSRSHDPVQRWRRVCGQDIFASRDQRTDAQREGRCRPGDGDLIVVSLPDPCTGSGAGVSGIPRLFGQGFGPNTCAAVRCVGRAVANRTASHRQVSSHTSVRGHETRGRRVVSVGLWAMSAAQCEAFPSAPGNPQVPSGYPLAAGGIYQTLTGRTASLSRQLAAACP